MRIRQLNHCVYQTQYHIVWGTRYRRKILKYYVRSELVKILYRSQRRHPNWYFHNINTGVDHVHLQIEIPPIYPIAAVVRELKACSSAHLRKRFKFIDRVYGHSGIWSVGYFVSTIGLNEDQIRKYIDRQSQYDKGVDITAEFEWV